MSDPDGKRWHEVVVCGSLGVGKSSITYRAVYDVFIPNMYYFPSDILIKDNFMVDGIAQTLGVHDKRGQVIDQILSILIEVVFLKMIDMFKNLMLFFLI